MVTGLGPSFPISTRASKGEKIRVQEAVDLFPKCSQFRSDLGLTITLEIGIAEVTIIIFVCN